jgi:hypothetical protein
MSDRTSVFHDMLKDEILSNNPTSAIALADLWMAIRRTQSIAEKSVAERQRKRGQHLEQLEAAHEAGFDTIEEHAAHEAEVTKQQQEKNLRSKFGELMKRLVENGTPVEGVLPPTDRLFVSANGVLYLLSKEDEFALLSCGAATL